jgi:cytochrome c551/c552
MVSLRLNAVLVVLFLTVLPSHIALSADPLAPVSKPEMTGDEFFERKVRPLLVQHCYSCHAKGQKKGGLSLADRAGLLAGGESGAVIALEKPDESLLITAVERNGGLDMPPNTALSESEVGVLKQWVQLGAPWPETASKSGEIRSTGVIAPEDRAFWAFQPVKDPAPPEVADKAWPRRPLDHFILAELEANGLTPVAEADRRTYIRRASFDLLGLPPTPEETTAFVSDETPQAYERLIDRLLQAPQYGERWARHWLDVARYGEDQAHTFQARTYPSGYRYRDWVVGAFNADMPYDRFILEQLAGDLLADTKDQKDRYAALGFLALGPVYYKDAGCAGKAESDELDDRIDTVCRGLLGLTVSCARCHDHKFDPIPTKDYYSLAGVFASTQYQEQPLAPDDVVAKFDAAAEAIKTKEKKLDDDRKKAAKEFGESLAPMTSKYLVAAWRLNQTEGKKRGETADELAKKTGLHRLVIERWADFLKSDVPDKREYFTAYRDARKTAAEASRKDDPELPKSIETAAATVQEQLVAALQKRSELDADYEKRLAEAPDADKKKVEKTKLDPAQVELLKDLLTDRNAPFAIPNDRVQKLLPDERQSALKAIETEIETQKKELGPKYPIAHSLKDGSPANMKVNVRGNHKELGEEAPRHFLSILSPGEPAPFREGSGRLELARAIADPANPLTARVIVNRIWLNHFGRGLVGTPSNFGLLGERPTHPDLLDHLASQFTASGWSIKQLHREILLSATYRLSSDGASPAREKAAAADPDNRLLWRQNRRRLDIESWRDAMLAVSGTLDATLGGPAVNLNDAGNRRRTLYAAISRHELNATLRLFDFPDPNLTSERRVSTTVPMQQLFALNSEFIVRQARAIVKRLDAEGLSGEDRRIERAYSLLFQRSPSPAELEVGLAYLQASLPESVAQADVKLTAWERYAQALLATNEFVFVD